MLTPENVLIDYLNAQAAYADACDSDDLKAEAATDVALERAKERFLRDAPSAWEHDRQRIEELERKLADYKERVNDMIDAGK